MIFWFWYCEEIWPGNCSDYRSDGNFTKAVGVGFAEKCQESRDAIIKILEGKGLLESVDENYVHNLSVCYRCDTPIEPLISEQWFIDVNKPVIKDKKIGGSVGNRHAYSSLKQKLPELFIVDKLKLFPNASIKFIFIGWITSATGVFPPDLVWPSSSRLVCVGWKCLLTANSPLFR